jgi:hypothetical protein
MAGPVVVVERVRFRVPERVDVLAGCAEDAAAVRGALGLVVEVAAGPRVFFGVAVVAATALDAGVAAFGVAVPPVAGFFFAALDRALPAVAVGVSAGVPRGASARASALAAALPGS